MIARATVFFEESAQGWSETYYFAPSAFTENAIAFALFNYPDSGSIVATRVNLLPASVQLVGIRVSDPANPRTSLFFAPNTNYPTNTSGEAVGSYNYRSKGQYGRKTLPLWQTILCLEVDDAVKVRLQNLTGTARRILLLRGIPEPVSGINGQYLSTISGWIEAMQAFRAALIQGAAAGCQLRTQTSGLSNKQAIVSLVTASGANNFLQIIVPAVQNDVAGNPIQPGGKVIIRGYKGGYRVNGPWTVYGAAQTVASGTQYTLGPRRRNVAISANAAGGGATLQGLAYTYVPVTSAADEGLYLVERRTGRPFGLLAGKRPVR